MVKLDTVYSSDIPGGAGRRDAHRLPLLSGPSLFGSPYMVHIRTWFGHAAYMVQTWFRYGSDMVQTLADIVQVPGIWPAHSGPLPGLHGQSDATDIPVI